MARGETAETQPLPGDAPGQSAQPASAAPPKRRRRWRRRFLLLGSALVVLLLALIAAAPYVLATRAGLDQLANYVSNRINGWIELESATLSWLSPVELRGVRVLDAEGRRVLSVERIAAGDSLLSAIFSGLDFGEARIVAPQATIIVDARDRVSLVDALQPRYPSPPRDPSGSLPRPRGRIVLTDGRVTLERSGGSRAEITDIDIDVQLDTLSAIRGDVSIVFADGAAAVGKLDVRDLTDEQRFRPDRACGTLSLKTRGDVQLEPLTAILAPDAAVTGALTIDASAETQDGATRGRFDVRVTQLQTAQATGTLAPLDLALTGELARSPDALSAQARITGDAGQIDADLAYSFGGPTAVGGERLLALLLAGEPVVLPDLRATVGGGLDLARLQRALPGLVPARPGSQLTAGRLELAQIVIRGGAQPTATGSIAVRDLAGADAGRPIRVEPIELRFEAGIKPGVGLNIGHAELRASFASLTARGDAANLNAEFEASLARLQQDVGQLFDLRGVQLAGELRGQLGLTRGVDERVNVALSAAGDALRVRSGGAEYAAQHVSAQQTGAARLRGGTLERFESTGGVSATGVTIDGAAVLDGESKLEWQNATVGDAAAAVRAELVRFSSSAATIAARNLELDAAGRPRATADLQAQADLAGLVRAAARVAKSAAPPAVAGRLGLQARISTEAGTITLAARGGIDDLAVGEGASAVREPRVDLEFDAGLDPAAERIRVTQAAVRSTPLSAEIGGTVEHYAGPRVLALRGRYEASWEELTRILHELAPATTGNILARGKSSSTFEVTGPLNQPEITPAFRGAAGGLDVTWAAAELYGVQLGSATLKPALRDGKLTLPPTAVAAAGGRVNVGGMVDFTLADPTLVVPGETRLLDNVALTPLIGQALLSRINPIFLHMTRVEGRATLVARDVFVPFGASLKRSGRGTGVLDLQRVRVQPSGLMGLLLDLGGYGSDTTHVVEFGKVDFIIRDGRIVYDNFTMLLPPDFDLVFRGSVGFDSTIDLIVSVPVREGLLRKLGVQGPALAAARKLTGARVELPIVGTREKPQIDFKRVDVARLLKDAVLPDAAPEKAVEGILDILKDVQKRDAEKQP